MVGGVGGNQLSIITIISYNDTNKEFSKQVHKKYINMAQETFKDMRRILPISKQKMDWTGAQTMLARGFQGS